MCGLAQAAHAQSPPAAQSAPILRDIRISGAKELATAEIERVVSLKPGEPFTATPDQIAKAVESRYHDDGYSFARATAAFAADSGTLTVSIDEGVIDVVEFQGVDTSLARTLAQDFALRAGDVFQNVRAAQALEALLRPSRGAVRPERGDDRFEGGTPRVTIRRDLRGRGSIFDLVDRNGQKTLVIGLREPAGRFKVVPDFGEREDWFTPVDGFVPSLGFGGAVFDHHRFNHTYIAGHLSFKTAPDRAGYAVGAERPFFGSKKLYAGVELHELTATDDRWQITSNEASLAAVAVRRNYRDYYRRRGVQATAALRVHPQVELLFAWRGERHESLDNESDFSVLHKNQTFRSNARAADGRLNAFVFGASVDGQGFDRESLGATYRRHQLDTVFGEQIDAPEEDHERLPRWRVDWSTEVSAPDALGSDFDFSRHIVSGRARLPIPASQEFAIRAIGGWSDGVLPVQRQFGIGGIGSVHGYEFKEAIGTSLALINLEYSIGTGVRAIGFFDAGRVTSPIQAQAPGLNGAGFGVGLGGMRIDFGYRLDGGSRSPQVLIRFGRTF